MLDALKDIAFNPQFAKSRIEKERSAVLSEAQMMNTMDYRVSCEMLKYLHHENALGSRFPIGKTDQVKTWDRDKIENFWKKWYYPGNMTLYVVGVMVDGVEATKKLIEETFGGLTVNMFESGAMPGMTNGDRTEVTERRKVRQMPRPPVKHTMGLPDSVKTGTVPCPISIYRHPLLQQFTLSIFCKMPVRTVQTYADLKFAIMLRILTSIFIFRMQERSLLVSNPDQGGHRGMPF